MVEKTQRAITILQQRQAEAGAVRSSEELVADIQTKASLAIMEVKQAALEEIRHMKQSAEVQTKNKEEVSGCEMMMNCLTQLIMILGLLELWTPGN